MGTPRANQHRRPIDRSTVADDGDDRRPAIEDYELIVVSNRQPYRHDYESTDGGETITVDRPTGGLTAGLDPVMQRASGTWIAWGDGDADPDTVDGDDCVQVPPDEAEYTLKRLWLDDDAVQDYYYGYSNQVLWPLCHGALDRMQTRRRYWTRYREVNETFADAVLECAGEEPVVWFQDYHLSLAPRRVRDEGPDGAFLMHFWHIPWPEWDTFRACPRARELLHGLLGNDLLGFHTSQYCRHFLRCVDAALDDAVVDWDAGRVHYRGVTTAVRAFPMGVDADRIDRLARSTEADEYWEAFGRRHGIDEGTRVALGVDRLDYTKGIENRLAALEHLWETRPAWRGRLTYVQNAAESRSQIPAYREVQADVESAVDRINRRFGTDDWQPVIYTTERIPMAGLCGLYRHSDVAIVSAVRDGMNLVAQEYVAAQTDGDGVLVLSTQVGAHERLGDRVVSINPYAIEDIARRVEAALMMPEAERRRRTSDLRERVFAGDLSAWMDDIFRTALALRDPSAGRPPRVGSD